MNNRIIQVSYNTGPGNFENEIISEDETGTQVAVAMDFDNDNDVDIIISSRQPGLSWFENNGNGFSDLENLEAHSRNPDWMKGGDVDLDGRTDLLTINDDTYEISWTKNLQNGSLKLSM